MTNEIDQVRLKITEEMKGITPQERADHMNQFGEAAAKKYGFKRVASAKDND